MNKRVIISLAIIFAVISIQLFSFAQSNNTVTGIVFSDLNNNGILDENEPGIADVLVSKTLRAARRFRMDQISVGGGVAANSEIRRRFKEASKETGIRVYLPPRELCTDNAAMIAALAFYKLRGKPARAKLRSSLKIDPSLKIKNWG